MMGSPTLDAMSSMDDLKSTVRLLDERAGLVAQRDRLIAQAHEDRFTWEEIAAAAGLSRQAAYNAAQRARAAGFEPLPFDRA